MVSCKSRSVALATAQPVTTIVDIYNALDRTVREILMSSENVIGFEKTTLHARSIVVVAVTVVESRKREFPFTTYVCSPTFF